MCEKMILYQCVLTFQNREDQSHHEKKLDESQLRVILQILTSAPWNDQGHRKQGNSEKLS